MSEFTGIVRKAARTYFWPGADREDVEQEAWLALERAKPESHALAKVVVHRHLIEQVRRETRRRPQFSLLTDTHADPVVLEEIAEQREQVRRIATACLSQSERRALVVMLNGEPYKGNKSVDNALTRARRKLRQAA